MFCTKQPAIPANAANPEFAVSVTYTNSRKAENTGSIRYLDYLNNRPLEKRVMKTMDLCDQKTAPLTPKSFIYIRRPFSQAGRRGFESRLPLQKTSLSPRYIPYSRSSEPMKPLIKEHNGSSGFKST